MNDWNQRGQVDDFIDIFKDWRFDWLDVAQMIRDADQIVVLDGGRVVELGTHDELLARGGRYASLVTRDADTARLPGLAEIV